jgi:hypothetical protein
MFSSWFNLQLSRLELTRDVRAASNYDTMIARFTVLTGSLAKAQSSQRLLLLFMVNRQKQLQRALREQRS